MNKKIKVKIVEYEPRFKFEILDDAKKGDFFYIDEYKDEDIENYLSSLKNSIDSKVAKNAKDIAVKEFKASDEYISGISKINEQKIIIDNLKSDLNKAEIDAINKFKSGIEYENKNKLIEQLKENILKLENEKKTFDLEKEKIMLEAVKEYKKSDEFLQIQKSLQESKEENIRLEESRNNIKSKMLAEHKLELTQRDYNTLIKISEAEKKLDELTRNRSSNIKLIGENLENWIFAQVQEAISFEENCNFYKDNEIIENTKADFIFDVFSRNDSKKLLGRILIEAKSQGETGNKKNVDYLPKLKKDKDKKNADFALLVSELEMEKEFLISKAHNYENIYIIRPAYLISFLSVIKHFINEREKIADAEILFKEKKEILEEFDLLKTSILNNSIKHIEKQANTILKNAETIMEKSREIKSSISLIVDTHFGTVKNKIEKFTIQKLTKKIEKLNDEK
ncbi:DUF2130 domain-containing protein [Mesomycoplasma lagogenitalium]|uniref:DUF2130 domain-containing protein n=1 Tax=Mesomycoplasma lagogenitalium TaxID=171286 RepID=A0ABY8LST1_9BACT|nr:DUF2130 domain-containing protein [Mesomycoplasma lagogenitalium]WGI36321.1 DUF2130 domain-containing protein [Mesomycoplasma lagogenitalium]